MKQGSFIIQALYIHHDGRADVWTVKDYSFTEFACQMQMNSCHVTLLAKIGWAQGSKRKKRL